MKKNAIVISVVIGLLILIVVTAFVLLNKNNKKVPNYGLEFKNEYEKLNGKMARYNKPHRTLNIPEDNPYVKIKPEDVLTKIENKETFYLYVGDPLCPWCRSVIEQSIKSAKENNIKTIYYIDFWDDENKEILRDVYELVDGEIVKTVNETEAYKKMLDLCSKSLGLRNYTIDDKDGNSVVVNEKRFYGPTFLFIKEGKFSKYTEAKSEHQKSPIEELTTEIKNDQANKFEEFFLDICDDAC